MFTNANVLFKAKFRDGVSNVERFVQHQATQSSRNARSATTTQTKGKNRVVEEDEEDKENVYA